MVICDLHLVSVGFAPCEANPLFFADVLYSHVECLQLNSIPEPH